MVSNFIKGLKVEKEVSKFIDKYMYTYVGNNFKRELSEGQQQKGIDVIFETNDFERMIIEEIHTLYSNEKLQAFTFELSHLNHRGEVKEGWLLNSKLVTTHYNVMWVNILDRQIKPKDVTEPEIDEVESLIISKNILLEYLATMGLSIEKLKSDAEHMRGSNDTRVRLTPYIELIIDTKMPKKPVSLKIDKNELTKLSDYHFKSKRDILINMKTNKLVTKDSKPIKLPYGYKAEKIVYDAVKRYSAGRDCYTYMHFPLHNYGFEGRREIDILMIDRVTGITVVEVKGITINQITDIQGGDWHMKDYFGKNEINPYRQGELQLNSLCDYLEEESNLSQAFTKRVMVALPYITRAEWESRGYHTNINMPPVLLKDDLQDPFAFERFERTHLTREKQPLTNEKWALLKSKLSIETDESLLSNQGYSSVYVFPDKNSFYRKRNEIYHNLIRGIKVSLFCYFTIKESLWESSVIDVTKIEHFKEIGQLECFESSNSVGSNEEYVIHDGERKLPYCIIQDFKQFNYKQYNIVHAPVGEHLMVTAGAGTGKTHVMIDRIMFLLSKKVDIKDIIMITFTNDSTNQMKNRLQKKLTSISAITGRVQFSEYAEDISDMQISTIHAYSKTILKDLSHELGYGINMQLRSFIHEKKEIINDLIDEYYQSHPEVNEIHYLPHYELRNIISQMWDEMEKKGLSRFDMSKRLEWGAPLEKSGEVIHGLFKYVFTHCEDRLDQIKHEENAVSMNDLIRKIKEINLDVNKITQLESNKYLFMDEFQDSDNVQIDLVASLAKKLNYKLFIVGDTKQSIYRFRGADYRSFDVIGEKIVNYEGHPDFLSFNLNQNYRSSSTILDKIDPVFSKWGEKNWLRYNDKLIGMNERGSSENNVQFVEVDHKDRRNAVIDAVHHSLKKFERIKESGQEQKDEEMKVALIVRTNKDAQEIAEWCKDEGIGILQNLDGTFYKSEAVRDFKSLLDGLLFPESAIHVVNALQSPYFRYEIPYKLLMQFNGENDEILSFINQHIGDDFQYYVEQIKTLPVMAVFQKIIAEKSVFAHLEKYFQKTKEDNANLTSELLQYKKNLYHLLNIIEQNFDVMNTTLYNIHHWLTLQMRTNRSENEPVVETTDNLVEVTTVHRAKGLEYHTVIIPKTTFPFNAQKSIFHIEESMNETDNRKVGWYIKGNKNRAKMESSYYSELNQKNDDEVNKEETRLLYVALTRVIEKLVVILPNSQNKDTWSALIRATGVEVDKYGS